MVTRALKYWRRWDRSLSRHPWKQSQTDENRFHLKSVLLTPCNQVSEIIDLLTRFLRDYTQLCRIRSTCRGKDTELKIIWLTFTPCLYWFLFCFIFSGPSPYKTEQFIGASKSRKNAWFLVRILHFRGKCNLISGAAFWWFLWSLYEVLLGTAVFISNEKWCLTKSDSITWHISCPL